MEQKKINKRIFIAISITCVRHVFFICLFIFKDEKKRNGNEWT